MTKRGYDEEIADKPHDAIVKRTFSKPEAAAVELRAALPPALTTRIDWDSLRVESGSFIDPKLKPIHNDILYSVSLRESTQRVLIYVLVEHQSTPDRMMAVRLLSYVSHLYDRYLGEHKGAESIPMLVPLLLYQGAGGWTMPTRLSELLDVPQDLAAAFPSPIELNFGVDDLSEPVIDDQLTRDELVHKRGAVLAEVVRTLMWLCRQPQRPRGERGRRLGMLMDLVAETWGNSELLAVLTYAISAFGTESPLRGILLESASQETRQMYATMRDEFIATGRAEGEAKGEARGQIKGMARMVERLLLKRDLILTDELHERLAGCEDEDLLQRWFDRALTATSVAEVFSDEPRSTGH